MTFNNTKINPVIETLEAARYWVGMRDEITEGLWAHYPSETPMSYMKWVNNQPDGGRASNCGAYYRGYVYDEPCSQNYKPLCEMP